MLEYYPISRSTRYPRKRNSHDTPRNNQSARNQNQKKPPKVFIDLNQKTKPLTLQSTYTGKFIDGSQDHKSSQLYSSKYDNYAKFIMFSYSQQQYKTILLYHRKYLQQLRQQNDNLRYYNTMLRKDHKYLYQYLHYVKEYRIKYQNKHKYIEQVMEKKLEEYASKISQLYEYLIVMKKGEKLLYGRDKLDLKDKYNVSREKPMDSKHSSLENSHIRFSNLNINALYESMNSRVVNGNGRGYLHSHRNPSNHDSREMDNQRMKRITSPSSVSRMHNENDSVLKDGGWNEGRKFQRELLRRYEEEGEYAYYKELKRRKDRKDVMKELVYTSNREFKQNLGLKSQRRQF